MVTSPQEEGPDHRAGRSGCESWVQGYRYGLSTQGKLGRPLYSTAADPVASTTGEGTVITCLVVEGDGPLKLIRKNREDLVGEALKSVLADGVVKREELFIQTK